MLGFENIYQLWGQDHVLDFVHELFLNTEEHATPRRDDNFPRSTRAIILQKLSSVEQIIANRRLSSNLKSYLEAVLSNPKWEMGNGFLSITVADQGPSIQATLPAVEGEKISNRIARAFSSGESRKPTGETERGLGLHRVLSAAYKLEGFIEIYSGGFQYYQHCSSETQPYPGLRLDKVVEREDFANSGTSFTLVVPEYKSNPDQQTFF